MLDSEIPLWPHQVEALEMPRDAFRKMKRQPTVVAPCGGGKSRIMRDIARGALDKNKRVVMLVHRRLLFRQMCEQFTEQGIDYGMIAAGHEGNPLAPIQICMNQTVASKRKKPAFSMPKADLVVVDEIHAQKAGAAKLILDHYQEQGALQVGFTATPVNCAGVSDELCVAADYSDMLTCGAHVPVIAFGPDRPDLERFRPKAIEYSEAECDAIIKVDRVFGRVYEHWEKYNPEALPAINFASSTTSARFWVHEFARKGVATASIDCKEITIAEPVTVEGVRKLTIKSYSSIDGTIRDDLFARHEGKEVKIIHNRFILREAWDAPYVYHCLITTPMGAICTYLQSVGRVLRSYPGYTSKIVQDHGGVIERLGFPNANREWDLEDTEASIRKKERKRRETTKGNDVEPICCPKCHSFRTHGETCPSCGHRHKQSIRLVRQTNGELKRTRSRVVKYKTPPTAERIWQQKIWGAAHSNATVQTAINRAIWECNRRNVIWSPEHFKTKLPEPSRRHLSVTEVFPWTRKRRAGSFSNP